MKKFMTTEDICRFKSFMVREGHTITSLAEAIGMKRESLSLRVNGKIDFEKSVMTRIAEKLNASPTEIFFEQKVT